MLASPSAHNKPRLLIVDDDPVLLQALPDLFSMRMPYIDAHACETSDEALRALTVIPYHTVVSDLRMPKMNGLTFMEEARQRGLTLPFLFMTGSGDYDLALKTFERGAQDFILKPFERDDLVRSTRLAIKVQHLRRQADERRQWVVRLQTRISLFQERNFTRTEHLPAPRLEALLLRADRASAGIHESIRLLQRQLHAMEIRYEHLLHCLKATEQQARSIARWRLERLARAGAPRMM